MDVFCLQLQLRFYLHYTPSPSKKSTTFPMFLSTVNFQLRSLRALTLTLDLDLALALVLAGFY